MDRTGDGYHPFATPKIRWSCCIILLALSYRLLERRRSPGVAAFEGLIATEIVEVLGLGDLPSSIAFS